MDMLLETKKVTKIFGGLHANSDIDFSIDEGEIVAIIGPSGSGKSTLLRCINGLNTITSGEIDLEGETGTIILIMWTLLQEQVLS